LGGLVSHQSPVRPREAGASRHGFGSAQQDAHQIAPPRLEIGGSSSSPYLTAPDARVVPVGCPYAVVTRARREDLRRDASSTVGFAAPACWAPGVRWIAGADMRPRIACLKSAFAFLLNTFILIICIA